MHVCLLQGLFMGEGRLKLWGRVYLRIQTTSEAEVKYISWLGDHPACSKSACVPQEKQAPSVPFRTGTGIGKHSPPSSPRKNHTTLEVQSNKYDGLLKSPEIGCHSRRKGLV